MSGSTSPTRPPAPLSARLLAALLLAGWLAAACTGAGNDPPSPGPAASPASTASTTPDSPGPQSPGSEPPSAEPPSPGPSSPAGPSPSAARTPEGTVTVAIVGDVMLGRRVGDRLADARDYAAVLRPTGPGLAGADITIGTLESTLARLGPPTQGDDSFAADPRVLRGLIDVAGFDVLSLANNHTGDFGIRSLLRTVRLVEQAGIEPVGAGPDIRQAWAPVIVEREGVEVGFLAFNAIGETPAAGEDSPGAASVRMEPRTGPLSTADLERARQAVRDLAARVDVVIVLPHWGEQYTHVPVDDQRRVARALVRAGADAVVGSHPHWTQPDVRYQGVPIVYSLGNFVFDMDWEREVREGNVAELTYRGDELVGFRLRPYVIGLEDFTPRFTR